MPQPPNRQLMSRAVAPDLKTWIQGPSWFSDFRGVLTSCRFWMFRQAPIAPWISLVLIHPRAYRRFWLYGDRCCQAASAPFAKRIVRHCFPVRPGNRRSIGHWLRRPRPATSSRKHHCQPPSRTGIRQQVTFNRRVLQGVRISRRSCLRLRRGCIGGLRLQCGQRCQQQGSEGRRRSLFISSALLLGVETVDTIFFHLSFGLD